jgi:membrane-bound inhibitor of C-type lysozyme
MMGRHVQLISMRWAASLSVLAMLPLAVQAETGIRAEYRCLGRFDAVDVTAWFFNQAPAELVLLEGQSAIRLPQLPSADGGRYGFADQEFWIKGDRARWRRAKGVVMQCQPPSR